MTLAWAGLTFLLTALGALWLHLTGQGPRDLSPAVILIAVSPSLAAFAVAACTGRLRALARQALDWRHHWGWYVLVLLAPIAIALTIDAVFALRHGAAPAQWLLLPGLAVLGPLLTGPLGEEFGWRGFGGPLLERRYSWLTASVIIGLLWTTWHLWPIFNAQGGESAVDVVQSLVRLVSTAVIYAWLYRRTGLPVVLVAHFGHNLSVELMPAEVIGSDLGALTLAAIYLVLAVTLVTVTGRRDRRSVPVPA
ncbi:CPBP family intramembrane glutamic endopeptidase [Nonomuraea sp. NPDC050310]|uniref:CPBP family intramembrane glutamic endopeptidase n=1 Tax=Nonomuraea sp. NPDC050310 TaxID=3154935 RepID=UPI0033F2E0F5